MRGSPLFLVLGLAACAAPSTTPVTTAPTPASPALSGGAPTADSARVDWHLLDAQADGVAGISLRRAERELLAGRTALRPVVVAVIDGGVDTAHVDLRANLWVNPREPGVNGVDDDQDGLVDDVHGWSFIGGPGGDVNWDTLELTREHVRCRAAASATVADSTRTRCATLAEVFATRRQEVVAQAAQVRSIDDLMQRTLRVLRTALGDSITAARVEALAPTSDSVRTARTMYQRLSAAGISAEAIADARQDLEGRLAWGYNPDFDPRAVVGDNRDDVRESRYGNRNVTGPDAKHGSHVAGIIGAVRGNGGIDGIAPDVRLMVLRAVPNGDERDKDVANAIRYAVDHGAQVINLSFGKGLSPQKGVVDEAVRHAMSRGALIVHAAGNDGADLAREPNFPTPRYLDGNTAGAWIEVGASSWKGGEQLAAAFSNYGKDQVDVFAPGEDIHSTLPGGTWGRESGTSMAAPVVSGLAALLLGHFPALSAADVKRVILESATDWGTQLVIRPGSADEKVPFGSLSRTGGVVNAWAAVRAAQRLSRPIP